MLNFFWVYDLKLCFCVSDLDDTLYSLSSGLAKACLHNIKGKKDTKPRV